MEIHLHTVGKIVEGDKYKNWYVFIQTYQNTDSYLVLISNNRSFGLDDEGNLLPDTEGYDDWIPDIPSLEYYLTEKYNWVIEWLPDYRPGWLEDVAQ